MAALQYKDDHNRIAYLGRERGSEDFTDILSYLDHSPLRYALTHDPPVVFDSLVKQFWATATVRPNAAGSHDLVATIDGREVVVTESLIRAQLQLDDANGIFDMQIDDIFAGMGAIGYPPGRTLTFLKHHLSPQWRFLVHTILHCLSPKAGSWNQFPSSIATALICLSTGRVYNFSRFILEGMIANVKATRHKFLMYPRFLQMLVAIETADRTPRPTFGFTRKLFSNMKLKWEGEAISDTTHACHCCVAMMCDEGKCSMALAVDGSPAEAHTVPHPPPFSPCLLHLYARSRTLITLNSWTLIPFLRGFYEGDTCGADISYHHSRCCWDEGRGPALLTRLSAKIDRSWYGERIKPMRSHGWWVKLLPQKGVVILSEVDLVRIITLWHLMLGSQSSTVPSADMRHASGGVHAPRSSDVLPHADISESAGPSVGCCKGKAPMQIWRSLLSFLQEDAQQANARRRSGNLWVGPAVTG
ncbi:hypothetical protein Tco_1112246 [Tanacetum coccineum]|uniref:Uncharacterized protein n=1 Tax=Tanacetum coccineum TaxID=301880 RepID=A0ABQ5IRR3_9ASTR